MTAFTLDDASGLFIKTYNTLTAIVGGIRAIFLGKVIYSLNCPGCPFLTKDEHGELGVAMSYDEWSSETGFTLNTVRYFLKSLVDMAWLKRRRILYRGERVYFYQLNSAKYKNQEQDPPQNLVEGGSQEVPCYVKSHIAECEKSHSSYVKSHIAEVEISNNITELQAPQILLSDSYQIKEPPTPTSGGGTVCFTHAENGEGEQGLETEGEEVEFLADSRDDIEEPVSEPAPPAPASLPRGMIREAIHKAGDVLGGLFSTQGATADGRRAIPPSPTRSPSSPPQSQSPSRYGTRASGTNQRALGTNQRAVLAREGEEVLRLAKERYQREQEELLRLASEKPPGGETDSFAAEVKGLSFSKMFEVAKARIVQQKQKKGA